MTRRLLVIFLLIAARVAASAPPRGVGVKLRTTTGAIALYAESHALIIGESVYSNGWPSLPGVTGDVKEVRAALDNQGFHTIVAMNPTRAALEETLRDFVSDYGQLPEARLLIYFAGHGYTITTDDGRMLGYFVPSDAPLPARGRGPFKKRAISMTDIETIALQIESKHVLFVFDSCFSGSIFDATRAVPDDISEKTAKPVRQFITAGTADQTVPDHSIFREQFVEGIGGEADSNHDGYVTGSELGAFLQSRVTNYSHRAQVPQYGKLSRPKLDIGDFVFVPPVTQPKPVLEPPASEPQALGAEIELTYWRSIQDRSDPALFRAYLQRFPLGTFAEIARSRITAMEAKVQPDIAAPATEPGPLTATAPGPTSTQPTAGAPLLRLPRVSPAASIEMTVGSTTLKVGYSRASVRGRKVFGELVPWNTVWRTGANEATTFTTNSDIMIEGQKLAAGKYALFTIPTPGEWTVIFNKEPVQWGAFNYDASKDALRARVKAVSTPPVGFTSFQETLGIDFRDTGADSTTMTLEWERTRVPIRIAWQPTNLIPLPDYAVRQMFGIDEVTARFTAFRPTATFESFGFYLYLTSDVTLGGRPASAGSHYIDLKRREGHWVMSMEGAEISPTIGSVTREEVPLRADLLINDDSKGALWIQVGNEGLDFPIEVPTVRNVLRSIRTAIAATRAANDWQTPYRAASFVLDRSPSLSPELIDEARGWLEQSLVIQQNASNLFLRARYEFSAGKHDAAIATAEKALSSSTDAGVTSEIQKTLRTWKAK